jgi:flagellar hook protein FlgE
MKSTGTDGLYTVELTDLLDENGNSLDINGIKFGVNQTVADAKTLSLGSAYTYDDAAKTISYLGENGTETISLNSNALTDDQKKTIAAAFGYSSYDEFAKLYTADGNSVASKVDAGTFGSLLGTDGSLAVAGKSITGGLIQYDVSTGAIKSVNGLTNDLSLSLSFGNQEYPAGPFSTISIDFSASSNYNNNATSTIGADPGDKDGLGVGRKLGELSGVSIQKDGMIYASYDNGQTRLLGQIAVAEFANASGLEKAGDNLYEATLNSGEFDGIGVDISANGGYMETGVLEMSNVDLSSEFTEMITAQRGFQANSRIITVSDTLLEELVNLKR